MFYRSRIRKVAISVFLSLTRFLVPTHISFFCLRLLFPPASLPQDSIPFSSPLVSFKHTPFLSDVLFCRNVTSMSPRQRLAEQESCELNMVMISGIRCSQVSLGHATHLHSLWVYHNTERTERYGKD